MKTRNILYIIGILILFFWITNWQIIEYYGEADILFTWNLAWIENNQSTVQFKYWWNSFWWLFFIKKLETLEIPETVRLWSNIKTCNKKITWVYYNNQRWIRFWPLDEDTLTTLKNIPWNYDNTQITWWFFTNCDWNTENRIYWNITHTVWWYNYELIAWVELNFWWNTYLNFWSIINLPRLSQELIFISKNDWLFISWHIFDNYGWVGIVWWSGQCVDIRYTNPNTICSGEIFTQYSSCGNIKIQIGTKNCEQENEEQHWSAWVLCAYDDEEYLERWIFKDTENHRAFDYIENMRQSCLHRWKDTNKWLRIYYPDDYIKKSETIKTLSKIRGIVFDDFTIDSEDKYYPYETIFEDVWKNYWFVRYTDYALSRWIMNWLYQTINDKRFFYPESYITRNDAIKKLIEIYNEINWDTPLNNSSNLVDINPWDPYYNYIRQAESLWIIEWYRQNNGTYKFEWDRYISRAEFAKIVSIPFENLLIWY